MPSCFQECFLCEIFVTRELQDFQAIIDDCEEAMWANAEDDDTADVSGVAYEESSWEVEKILFIDRVRWHCSHPGKSMKGLEGVQHGTGQMARLELQARLLGGLGEPDRLRGPRKSIYNHSSLICPTFSSMTTSVV